MSTVLLNPATRRPFSDRNVRANSTLLSGQNALVKTSVAAYTLLLPAAPAADAAVCVTDADGSAATNNITIDGNGNNIDDAATLLLKSNFDIAVLLFDRGQWRAIAQQRQIEGATPLAEPPPVQMLGRLAVPVTGGTVTSVSGTAPIAVATPTTTPVVSIAAATTLVPGSMSAADKTKVDGLQKQGATTAIAALNIDWSLSGTYSKTLAAGGNVITFTNDADGLVLVVRLTGAASTVTWPAAVKWAGGTEPTQTASGSDIYTLVRIGADIFGSYVQDLS